MGRSGRSVVADSTMGGVDKFKPSNKCGQLNRNQSQNRWAYQTALTSWANMTELYLNSCLEEKKLGDKYAYTSNMYA